MIAQHDGKKNGGLDFEEFKVIFKSKESKPFGVDGPTV